jgi:hypothetical protein
VVSGKPSNFRELNNFVIRVKTGIEDGSFECGTDIFLFTDNFTADRSFFRGTTRSKELFGLVLSLRQLEMDGDCFCTSSDAQANK